MAQRPYLPCSLGGTGDGWGESVVGRVLQVNDAGLNITLLIRLEPPERVAVKGAKFYSWPRLAGLK